MWSSASDTLAPTVHLDSALQIIINQTPDVVFIKNKQGYITFMNATGIRLLGMSPEEIDGKSETDLFGITAGFEAWEHDFQVISSRQPKTVVAEWQIDGQIIHLQLTKHLHISPEGAILGIVGLGREVRSTGEDVWWTSPESGAHNEPNPRSGARSTATLGKAKDNSRSAASKVVLPETSAGAPSAVFGAPPVDHEIWDENRTLLSLQAATTAVTSSLDIDYLLDTLAWEMAHFLDADNCLIFDVDQNGGAATILAAYRPPPQENEHSIRLADCPLFQQAVLERCPQQSTIDHYPHPAAAWQQILEEGVKSLLVLPVIYQEQLIGLVGVFAQQQTRTFTDREISLAQLLISQVAGSVINARLYQQLDDTNQALQVSNEELNAFAHTVAHDLKGPLGLVIGFAEMLLLPDMTPSAEERQEFLRFIVTNGHKMRNIIDELLTLATVRREEVHCEPIDMAKCVDEAISRVKVMAAEHQTELECPADWPVAAGYAPWLEEVWVNYISNAIKYGGRPPCVQLGGDRQADGMVRFWVRDNGPGLTPEEQAQLYTSFTRLHREVAEGHGLGLTIVRRIVEKLGGEVGVESEPGCGSTFFFTLPENGQLVG